jgi:2-polyprenyl-6-methoxyphenol hydroxylase-like FAD-dependent oxidoreductase
LIIGGGIAGPVIAMALKRAGIEPEVYEAREESMDDAGAFLGIAPSGINALKTLDIAHRIEADGFPARGIVFFNGNGKRIGRLDSSIEEQRYGSHNVVIKRGQLHRALREEALRQDVIAHFQDGMTASGDFLIGADGIHSRTRQIMLPDGPEPVYTGMMDCGGFVHYPGALPSSGAYHMTFGKRAFFGYIVKPGGEVYWFSNVAHPKEPTRDELGAMRNEEWRQRLLALHGDDPAPIPGIIRATEGIVGKWPVYDMPFLPTWHKGPICLVGDAAHAMSPHIGQGASLALEDAIVLAKCLRDFPRLDWAFATYQGLRKERVETLIRQARRTGDRKIPNPVMEWFRDLMMPLFLKAGISSIGKVYSYRVDWDEKVA